MNLRLVFWELTRACNLSCPHCRASSTASVSTDDLSLPEIKNIIDGVSLRENLNKSIIVFSGGEPLLRQDIFDIISYTARKGLKPALATNATLITPEIADKLKQSGLGKVAVSIYGSSREYHDGFLNQSGAFDSSLIGIENLKKNGISIQINTTITKQNEFDVENIARLALNLGAGAYHIFLLVPVGRGTAIAGDEINPAEYEKLLFKINAFTKQPEYNGIFIKVTCAPHYYRIAGISSAPKGAVTKGCLAGSGVCFISHKGEVYPCGYLPVKAGDLKNESFADIWDNSPVFRSLRDTKALKGKCGRCEFNNICGGCRARAYAKNGDYFGEEPNCVYMPHL